MLTALLTTTLALALPVDLADRVATGDCAGLLDALSDPTTAEQRVVAARCHERLGAPDRALEVLEDLAGDTVWLDYGRLVRARAHLEAEQPKLAVAALDDLELPGATGREVRLLRAVALVQDGRSLDARPALRALLDDGEHAGAARYWLARGAEDRGDIDAAVATYRAAWARNVEGPYDRMAAERLAGLDKPVDALENQDARALALQRFNALRRAYQGAAALELLASIRVHDPVTSTAERLQWAKACFAGRDYARAATTYTELLATAAGRAAGGPAAAFDWALATSRTGDYATAAERYDQLRTWFPDSKQADTASYKRGYLAFDARDYDEARSEFASHLERYPGSEHATEALWFSAWAAFKLGELDTAVTDWARLTRSYPRSSLVPGAHYWTARVRGLQGDQSGRNEGLREVIRRWPTSGYAWFASEWLDKQFPAKEIVVAPELTGRMATDPRTARALALLSAGLRDWARGEVSGIAQLVSGDRAATLAAAHLLIRLGDYKRGKQLAAPHCTSVWKAGDPVAQQACTPLVERTIVDRTAARYGLDRLVPYGIMITESALDPTVTSLAGARGLMQLMPVEAERLHVELYGEERPYDPNALYSAPYNASLGVAELGGKLKSLTGVLEGTDLPAAIASYNGGEAAVRRWVGTTEEPPPFDIFTEDIGYTETRRYVKRVLGHTMSYRWVYGD